MSEELGNKTLEEGLEYLKKSEAELTDLEKYLIFSRVRKETPENIEKYLDYGLCDIIPLIKDMLKRIEDLESRLAALEDK